MYQSASDWLIAQTGAIARIRAGQADFDAYKRARENGFAPTRLIPFYPDAEAFECRYRDEMRDAMHGAA